MRILAVIPARGGSKGVPGKNIRPLCGKPLIAWTIEAAKAVKQGLKVIVSTDDAEIANVARAYGAEVPFLRPSSIAHDLSTDVEFLTHALNWLKEHEDYEPDIVLRLPPTSPLRTAAQIEAGIETLLKHPDADACRPICESPKHPYKLWKIDEDGVCLQPFLPESFTGMKEPYNLPRQVLPKAYIHTGAMDVMRTATIRDLKSTSGRKLVFFHMPPEDSVNIDHLLDFEMAALLMERRLSSQTGSYLLNSLGAPRSSRSTSAFSSHSMMKLLDDNTFDFSGLFVFEMANNHQGDLEHGKRIIREIAKVAQENGIRAAVKLQFRDLDTFVHPAERNNADNKHVKRFLSTRLTEEQFAELVAETKSNGLITMCTPFDETSVGLIQRLGIEVLKIGSCSAKDWPLLEVAAASGLPMIVSTGGLTMVDVDNVVSFLDHRYVRYALMHCVSIYPTPVEKLQLNQIERMRERYPQVTIGFSTHEEPNNTEAIKIAVAKGAQIFERHVGIATETITLNAYSSTPEQIANWILAYKYAVAACGGTQERVIEPEEAKDLLTLQRGVFVTRSVKAGERLQREDVFFAFPIRAGQLPSGKWNDRLVADQDYEAQAPLSEVLGQHLQSKKEVAYQAIHEIKGLLNAARIAIGTEFEMELSHHYGLDRFREVGTTIIDCVNREYCKKILVMLPGQQHPVHHHKRKEETFQVLSGELWIEMEGRRRLLYPGDTATVQRGVKHRFWSEGGSVFEEISSTHYNNDSIYNDPVINKMPREQRKTKLINWGRHQFD